MTQYRYLLPADEEMTEAAIFYEGRAKGLGMEFLDDLQRAIDQILDNPESGQIILENFRRSILSRFPFSLIYTIETESILIIAVAHQRRRPYYWKERIIS